MSREDSEVHIARTARMAGLLYLLMFPLAAFSVYFRSSLITDGDAVATANSIMASEELFRTAIIAWLTTQVLFILLVLILYKILAPVQRHYAVLMVALALLAVPIAFVNEINQFAVLLLLSDAAYFADLDTATLSSQVMFFLDLHQAGGRVAWVLWGLWLLPFGYLVFQSGFLPRFLGILLFIGGAGYLVDFVSLTLNPDLGFTIGQFTSIGEVLVPLWLIIKGVDAKRWASVFNQTSSKMSEEAIGASQQ